MCSHPNRRRARALVASIGLATLVLLTSAGQPAEAAGPDDLRVIAVTQVGDQVEIVVSVPAVLANRTLSPGAFTVEANGEAQPLTVTRRAPDQIDLAVVAMASASDDPRATDATRAALVELLVSLPIGARVAVIGDEPPRVLAPLSTDVAALSTALAVPPSSPASADQAMRLAAEAVSGARRPAVLVVGPGASTGTVPSWWPTDVARYVTRVEPGGTLSSVIADATGGVNTTTDPAGVVGALDAVVNDLVGQYEITVASPASGGQSVRVRVTAPELTAEAVVAWPPLVEAPTITAPPATPASPASPAIPASPTVAQSPTPDAAPSLDDGLSGSRVMLVLVLVGALAAVGAVGAVVAKRRGADRADVGPGARPGEPTDVDAVHDRMAPVSIASPPGAGPPGPTPMTSTTIVLATPASSDARRPLPDGPFELVYSAVDALREAVRHGATTILVEPGTGDPSVLVHAVDNHNRAGGRTTRVVTITDAGVVIDLTAAP